MKPKPIKQFSPDTTLQSIKMSIETPLVKIESVSGNDYLDVASIIFVIGVMYIGKRIIGRYFDGK